MTARDSITETLTGPVTQVSASLVLAAMYVLCRGTFSPSDLSDAAWAVAGCAGLLGVSPSTGAPHHNSRMSSVGFWCLWVLLFAIVAIVFVKLRWDARAAIAAFGILQVLFLLRRLAAATTSQLMSAIAVSGLIGLLCGSVLWGSGVLNPYLDQRLTEGGAHLDTLMHLSVCQMLATHGICSTGLDGVPYFPYHWGSHLVLKELGNVLGMPISTSYALLFPVICVPLFLRMFLDCCSVCMQKMYGTLPRHGQWLLGCVLFFIWPVSLLTFAGGVPAGLQYVLPWISESLVISLIFVWAGVCLILELRGSGWAKRGLVSGPLLCGLVCVATLCKVTSGFGLVVWLSLFALQQSFFDRDWRWLLIAVIPSIFGLLTVMVAFSGSGQTMPRSLFGICMSLVRFGFVRNVALYVLPALLPLIAQTLVIRDRSAPTLIAGYMEFRGGLAGCFAMLFLIVPLPATMLHFVDNEKYFFWTPVLVCGPACAAAIGAIWTVLPRSPRVLLNATAMLSFFALATNEGLDLASQARQHHRTAATAAVDSPRMQFLQALQQLGEEIPPEKKRRSVLFIPNQERHQLLDINSLSDLFLPVTLTGIAQVYGQPDSNSQLATMQNFSVNLYDPLNDSERTEDAAEKRAVQMGFTNLVTVRLQAGRILLEQSAIGSSTL